MISYNKPIQEFLSNRPATDLAIVFFDYIGGVYETSVPNDTSDFSRGLLWQTSMGKVNLSRKE